VISDLSNRRRAQIRDITGVDIEKSIAALVPLKEIVDYSTELRSMTQGNASYNMEFDSYTEMSDTQQKLVLKEIRGF
jgi:elongation factor G